MLFSTENNLNAIKERKKKSFTKSVQEAVKKSENENIRGPSTCVECVTEIPTHVQLRNKKKRST